MLNRTVYTIGHSTHSADEFVKIIQEYGIEIVVDVRTIAGSRHNPQFGEDVLKQYLTERHVNYQRIEGLGGLRHTSKTSVNTAWNNLSFRGYADYMQSLEFKLSLDQLIRIALENQTVIMCAEAVPWRCHRSLIGDALLIRSIPVVDIISQKTSRPHELTQFAKVEGDKITYPGASL